MCEKNQFLKTRPDPLVIVERAKNKVRGSKAQTTLTIRKSSIFQ